MKYVFKCDRCGLEWATKGPGHRVFHRYRPGPDATPNPKTGELMSSIFVTMLPMYASWVKPQGEYDGQDPRLMRIEFGPYDRATLTDAPFTDEVERWAVILDTLAQLGPTLIAQMACPHAEATQIGEE